MKYYKSNALYDYLIDNNISKFSFTKGDSWQLIYGDKSSTPKLIVYVVGVDNAKIKSNLTDEEEYFFALTKKISKKTNLPYLFIRFATDLQEVSNVQILVNDSWETLTMNELSNKFKEAGLPVSNSSTQKAVNDRTSSAYHKWQRNYLGRNLVVADIDLWEKGNGATSILELKRSYYDLSRWTPFSDDHPNFRLISNLCNMLGINFKIVYNVRHKNPIKEDIRRLKIFDVDFSRENPIKLEGVKDLEEFIK